MKITPALPYNSKYLIWELSDINLHSYADEVLTNGTWKGYNEGREDYKKQPGTRLKVDSLDESIFNDTFSYISNYIFNNEDYSLTEAIPDFESKKGLLKHTIWGVEIIKDLKEFYLGIHLDSPMIASTCIINLTDNPSAVTEYFSDREGKNPIYKASGKKNTGIVHINTPYLFHGASNNSEKERCILLANLVNATL